MKSTVSNTFLPGLSTVPPDKSLQGAETHKVLPPRCAITSSDDAAHTRDHTGRVLPQSSVVRRQLNVLHDSPVITPEVVMKFKRHGSLIPVLAIALCGIGTYFIPQSSDAQDVVAQSITAAKTSAKVVDVLWTRRPDHYTLQVVLPKPDYAPTGRQPDVTLWLLGADGVAIPTSRVRPVKNTSTFAIQYSVSEISYAVPLSSGQSAVAVALKIDNDYFIQKLKPLD
jgi:hypothetical protein